MNDLEHEFRGKEAPLLRSVRSLEDYQGLVGHYAYYREPPMMAAVVQVLWVGQIGTAPRVEKHPEDFIDMHEHRADRHDPALRPALSGDAIEVCFRVVAAHLGHEIHYMAVGKVCIVNKTGGCKNSIWRFAQVDGAMDPLGVMRAVEARYCEPIVWSAVPKDWSEG